MAAVLSLESSIIHAVFYIQVLHSVLTRGWVFRFNSFFLSHLLLSSPLPCSSFSAPCPPALFQSCSPDVHSGSHLGLSHTCRFSFQSPSPASRVPRGPVHVNAASVPTGHPVLSALAAPRLQVLPWFLPALSWASLRCSRSSSVPVRFVALLFGLF